MVQTAQQSTAIPHAFIDKEFDVPVVQVHQVRVQFVEETVEIPQLQLGFLPGHCRSHARRCATTDCRVVQDVTVAVDIARLISSWRR